MKPTTEEVAKHLYNAYGDNAEWKNFRGDPMPKWEELPQNIRDNWCAAAEAGAVLFDSDED